jgi:hypothetical protein
MRINALPLLLLPLLVASARAECSVHSAASRPRLVELYTSEGCSSCPPADAWLRRLPEQGGLTALEFHVDYWNSLGWRDRFSDPRYTARQEQQARRDGGSGVYTPQVVLDGHSWSGWYRAGKLPSEAAGLAAMRLTVTPGTPLHVRVVTTFERDADAAGFRNYVAVTENGLTSDVRAGENRGSQLRHDHVVRAFAGPLRLADETDITVPGDVDAAHAQVVAFAQRASDGAVAQVLQCGL